MLIPLDYYRILGLPIQATTPQLQQAYRQRSDQLPRPEYSQAAITLRQQLIDEAYRQLSQAASRQAYDETFLAGGGGSAPPLLDAQGRRRAKPPADRAETPMLDLDERQFVGALLLLQELGEYELVLELGYPHLSNPGTIEAGRFGEPQLALADILLTVVLAYLELGREQWHQGQAEPAATSLKIAQELLLHHGLFASLRGEIQADLYKLRPYRILELLAHPDENSVQHRQGLQLLRSMLKEREGIDGQGDDRSGLGVEDFLRFVQQLRVYLTTEEQLALFEAEAKRPSAVATFLTAYAAIARGFGQRQPAFVRQASLLLRRLGNRQDVFLEQAVCALLLGRPEEATRYLSQSQEQEAIALIRQQSAGAPDLLPGLCAYTEHWLRHEVFPHFRDLVQGGVSLKEYFADASVQSYLEALPEGEPPENEWTVVPDRASVKAATPMTANRGSNRTLAALAELGDRRSIDMPQFPWQRPTPVPSAANPIEPTASTIRPLPLPQQLGTQATQHDPTAQDSGAVARAFSDFAAPGSAPPPNNVIPLSRATGASTGTSNMGSSGRSTVGAAPPLPPGGADRPSRSRQRSDRPARTRGGGGDRLPIAIGVGIMVIGLGSFLIWRVFQALGETFQGGPNLEGEQPIVQLDRPVIEIPPPPAVPNPETALTAPGLNPETAQQLVQTWLSAKAAAMGREHQGERLTEILADPMLRTWRARSRDALNQKLHWEYEHQVKLEDVKATPDQPDRGQITAEVREVAKLFKNGKPDRAGSYNEVLRVRYEAQRKDGRWYLRDVKVLR